MSGSFDLFVGIDYSGARSPTCRLKELQVYAAKPAAQPEKLYSPVSSNNKVPWNWTRAEIAAYLINLARHGVRYMAGIDHGFSFPVDYFERYRLKSWPEFLDDFVRYWPTAPVATQIPPAMATSNSSTLSARSGA